ncbi:MAG: hypothetical protein F7C81_06145 [Desulfurococcales archaeon]|nr:hypothetical protein [Desulfurococcales archaeon]
MKPLRGAYSLDASILIEILAGSKLIAGLVNSVVAGDVIAYAARLGLTEALYVACRLWGWERALQRMQILVDSGLIVVIDDEKIWDYVASRKCEIPISSGECFYPLLSKEVRLKTPIPKTRKELLENLERIKMWLDREPEYLTA